MPYVDYLNRLHQRASTAGYASQPQTVSPTLDKIIRGEGAPAAIDPYTVHAFFDRLQHALPQFIPRGPSIVAGVIAGGLVVLLGAQAAKASYERTAVQVRIPRQSATPQQRRANLADDAVGVAQFVVDHNWALIVVASVYAASVVGGQVSKLWYRRAMMRNCKNQQYFAVLTFAELFRGVVMPPKAPLASVMR